MMNTIILPNPIKMKVKTVYPEHPLPENEWYNYIYNLLTKPYEPTTSSKKSISTNQRGVNEARREEHTNSEEAKTN